MPQETPQPLSPISSPSPTPKRKMWKFVVAFLAIILFAFVAFVGLAIFNQWRGEKRVEELAEYLKNLDEKLYQEQLADTVGGKTPQETLRLYIEAVERGDYERASKYWVLEKQEEELGKLKNSSSEIIRTYSRRLREESLASGGRLASDGKYFSFNGPILIEVILYPSDIWKIFEI